MTLRQLAERQLSDYDRHQPGSLFTDQADLVTSEEAYALQMAVADLRVQRGEPIAGYKAGCLSPAVQSQLGLSSPVFGHIFGTELHKSGAVLRPQAFDGLAIEGEFAIRLTCDIPDADWLHAHARSLIASWFVVIELHNYVLRGPAPHAQQLIANNALHAGVVLPQHEPARTDPGELAEATVRVSRNGNTMGVAAANSLPRGPLGSLVQLVAHLDTWGRRLRRGDLVLTGSPLPLYRVAEGDRIEVCGPPTECVTALVSALPR